MKARDVAETTRRAYLGDLARFLRWAEKRLEGRFDPASVTPIDVAAYRDELREKAGQSPASVNRNLASLRWFFAHLKQGGQIPDDPTEPIRGMRMMRATQPQALAPTDINALLRAARSTGWETARPRNYTLVQLPVQTGLRLAELLHLRWEDVSVRPKSGTLRVRAGKGLKERIIPLNHTARKVLADWKAACVARGALKEYVFASSKGNPLSSGAVELLLRELAQRARISGRVSPHVLRHTFATQYLIKHPGDLVGLASLLGHDSIATTAIYTKPTLESLAEKVEDSPLNVYHS